MPKEEEAAKGGHSKAETARNASADHLTGKESDAQDILSQVKQGGSFALLARERSIDETTGAVYGYLGEVGWYYYVYPHMWNAVPSFGQVKARIPGATHELE